MQNNGEVLIPIVMFIAAFGALYVFFTTRNKERLAMIEKGVDANSIHPVRNRKAASLKTGMFFVGVALGILTGSVMDVYSALPQEVCYFSMIFLFAGLSLIVFYSFVERKLSQKD